MNFFLFDTYKYEIINSIANFNPWLKNVYFKLVNYLGFNPLLVLWTIVTRYCPLKVLLIGFDIAKMINILGSGLVMMIFWIISLASFEVVELWFFANAVAFLGYYFYIFLKILFVILPQKLFLYTKIFFNIFKYRNFMKAEYRMKIFTFDYRNAFLSLSNLKFNHHYENIETSRSETHGFEVFVRSVPFVVIIVFFWQYLSYLGWYDSWESFGPDYDNTWRIYNFSKLRKMSVWDYASWDTYWETFRSTVYERRARMLRRRHRRNNWQRDTTWDE